MGRKTYKIGANLELYSPSNSYFPYIKIYLELLEAPAVIALPVTATVLLLRSFTSPARAEHG